GATGLTRSVRIGRPPVLGSAAHPRLPDRGGQVRLGQPPDVFIDRDGVVIRSRPHYVRSWQDVEVLPGALDAIGRLCRAGHRVMIMTNQSALARGLISEE